VTDDEIDSIWRNYGGSYKSFARAIATVEREACARVAERQLKFHTQACTGVAEAIRARGEQP
jgi:hypothetical protein